MNLHEDDPIYDPHTVNRVEFDDKDSQFLYLLAVHENVWNHELLCDVVIGAQSLEIPGLIDMGCRGLANSMKGKTAVELQDMLS
jgi:hypothetical protein